IGTDATGTLNRGNRRIGIFSATDGTMIGGTTAGTGNLISGNVETGVYLSDAKSCTIAGNFIGTDKTGTSAIGNSAGVFLLNGINNTIGDTTALGRNIISGNSADGIFLFGSSSGNTILGNYIGTDVTGTTALPNSTAGIWVDTGSNNTI